MNLSLRIVGFAAMGIVLFFLIGPHSSMAGENKGPQRLFLGVHHVGLYTGQQTDPLSLAKWYEKNFGFNFIETPAVYASLLPDSGSLEIMKKESDVKGHLGIEVSDFEAARKELESKGIELEPTVDVGPVLSAYLKGTDPAGYKIQLLYIKK